MTEAPETILQRLTSTRSSPRSVEQRIAGYILDNRPAVIRMSISNLAARNKVSDPTIVRFCRKLGTKGYRDFKLALATAGHGGTPFVHETIEPGDSTIVMGRKICVQTSVGVASLPGELDWDQIDAAITALASASRIECHGAGASGIVALDAQHKLFRLGIPVSASIDPQVQIMSAATLGPGSVLLSFSHTGRTASVLRAAVRARDGGATVIAVTTAETPLAELASIAITLPVIEDIAQYTPTTSRILALVIVDILEVGVALRHGPGAQDRIRLMKAALHEAGR